MQSYARQEMTEAITAEKQAWHKQIHKVMLRTRRELPEKDEDRKMIRARKEKAAELLMEDAGAAAVLEGGSDNRDALH